MLGCSFSLFYSAARLHRVQLLLFCELYCDFHFSALPPGHCGALPVQRVRLPNEIFLVCILLSVTHIRIIVFSSSTDRTSSVEPEFPTADQASGAGPTVVALDDEPGSDNGEDMSAPVAPVADMGDFTSSPGPAPKKRGRPSRSASGTPAVAASKAKKPAKVATPARVSSRKRKAAEVEPEEEGTEDVQSKDEDIQASEPEKAPTNRGRPARTTGVVASARLAAKAANKRTRVRRKSNPTVRVLGYSCSPFPIPDMKQSGVQKSGRVGRPKKNGDSTNGDTPAGEYEVEAIVDSMIDADTMEHMYLVRWKGYSASENTWEPKKNLAHAAQLVAAFDGKKKKPAEKESATTEKKKPGRKPGRPPKTKAYS